MTSCQIGAAGRWQLNDVDALLNQLHFFRRGTLPNHPLEQEVVSEASTHLSSIRIRSLDFTRTKSYNLKIFYRVGLGSSENFCRHIDPRYLFFEYFAALLFIFVISIELRLFKYVLSYYKYSQEGIILRTYYKTLERLCYMPP